MIFFQYFDSSVKEDKVESIDKKTFVMLCKFWLLTAKIHYAWRKFFVNAPLHNLSPSIILEVLI